MLYNDIVYYAFEIFIAHNYIAELKYINESLHKIQRVVPCIEYGLSD